MTECGDGLRADKRSSKGFVFEIFGLKNKLVRRYIPKIVISPDRTDKKRPANSGSEKNLRKGIVSHINNGCLPSVKGRNRKVSTAFITWDHRIYIASSAKTGSEVKFTNRETK